VVNQTKGLYHQHLRKRIHLHQYPHPRKSIRMYDLFMYGVVIVAPITNVPQLLKVWVDHDATGVSLVSWILFSFISVTWFVYGIIHKDKHILVMNAALMILQAFIAIGAYRYG
jgi:MtN3 and saliva related transmembrane protein